MRVDEMLPRSDQNVVTVGMAEDGCPLVIHTPVTRPEDAHGIKRCWYSVDQDTGWVHHEQAYSFD